MGDLKLSSVELADRKITQILDGRWFVASAAWSPDGEHIVVAGDFESKITIPVVGLWVVNRDGSNAQCRTDGLVGNVGLRLHHDMPTWGTSQANVFVLLGAGTAYASVTKAGGGEIWRIALEGPVRCEAVASGPRTCAIMDANAKSGQLLYAATDLNTPWDLYSSNLKGGDEKRLTNLNEAVTASWPALQVENLKFQSDDGMSCEGWFLSRADREGPQPTIMFIHGGPFLATGHAFRYDFHLLAANGYSVLFANFRGSAGYGEPFVQAIVGDWGARGFPDHMAAVDKALAAGLADPKRLGVWGPSHGGFATSWIVGHTDRFRAAVAESAVTDKTLTYSLTDAPTFLIRDMGGRPNEIPDVYRSRSPLSYASRCTTPTLTLIRGVLLAGLKHFIARSMMRVAKPSS
jgi:dipeptidyl aminopeptidase/acylaminoacyl peptidase